MANEESTSALDAALRYADIGWHVFPCQANKHPYTEHGFKDATTEHATIVRWWRRWPDAQIGVATGASGLCVLDLDLKPSEQKDGILAFGRLVDENGGQHGCNLIASTPRGGRHYVYLSPDPAPSSRTDVLPGTGIDVRAAGGYVIVPSPSSPGREWLIGDPFESHQDGSTDVSAAPSWVQDLLASRRPSMLANGPECSASARRRIEVASALHAIPPSSPRTTWLKAIFAVHAALDGDSFGAQLVEQWSCLTDVVAQYKPGEAERAYLHALLPEFTGDRNLVDAASLFALARSFGWRAAGAGVDDVEIVLGAPPAPEAAAPPEPKKPGILQLVDWETVASIPPVEWQVEDLIPEKSLVLLAGDTEAGKSFFALDLALRMIHGMPFCGRQMTAGSVIYLAGEGHAGLAGRLLAWRRHHLVSQAAAEQRYLLIADEVPVLSKDTMPKLAELVEMVTQERSIPAMVVIDTLSQGLLDGDENDAKVVAPILRGLSDLRNRFGCIVMLVHHLVKLNGRKPEKPTRDSIRGSGALTRNVDVVLGLVVENATSSRRLLHVWKSKDSEKPPETALRLEVVETGRPRRRGKVERSCVLIPDVEVEIGETKAQSEERKRRQAEAEGIRRILDAIQREGELNSREEVREAAELKKERARACLDMAMRRGLVFDVGTLRRPRYVLADHPEVPRQGPDGSGNPHLDASKTTPDARAHTPPIPPRTGSGSGRPDRPSPDGGTNAEKGPDGSVKGPGPDEPEATT